MGTILLLLLLIFYAGIGIFFWRMIFVAATSHGQPIQKGLWIVMMLFGFPLAGLLYYFHERKLPPATTPPIKPLVAVGLIVVNTVVVIALWFVFSFSLILVASILQAHHG